MKFALVGFVAWRVIRGEIPFLPEIVEKTPEEIILYFLRVGSSILLRCGLLLLLLAAARLRLAAPPAPAEPAHDAERGEGRGAAVGRRSQDQGRVKRATSEMSGKTRILPTSRPPTSSSPTRSTSRSRSIRPGRWARRGSSPRAPRAWRSGSRTVARATACRSSSAALARAIFASVPVGGEIPATLYRAVAEILAYIYGLRGRTGGSGGTPWQATPVVSESPTGSPAAGRRILALPLGVVVIVSDDHPAADGAARPPADAQHLALADHPAGRDVHAAAARVLRLPVGAAGRRRCSGCR